MVEFAGPNTVMDLLLSDSEPPTRVCVRRSPAAAELCTRKHNEKMRMCCVILMLIVTTARDTSCVRKRPL